MKPRKCTGALLTLAALALLNACGGLRTVQYDSLLRLSLIDDRGKTIWREELSVGDALDDEGYPLESIATGRICVGERADACAHERELQLTLVLRTRGLDGLSPKLNYRGQLDVRPSSGLPVESRSPEGDMPLAAGKPVEVELLKGLRLRAELP
ncbi:MAG: hypothetical protein HYV16_05285 [Gammaproteobacteria bacterium]|nr:hypothetical protein [Gammaproteobacteria bacterium]